MYCGNITSTIGTTVDSDDGFKCAYHVSRFRDVDYLSILRNRLLYAFQRPFYIVMAVIAGRLDRLYHVLLLRQHFAGVG